MVRKKGSRQLITHGILAREADLADNPLPRTDARRGRELDEWVAGAVVFVSATLFYLFHTGVHSFWLDSAEFVTVARGAGVAHPPGTPLYTVLAHLATWWPVGSVAFRVHLLNVLLGGLVALLLYAIGLQLVTRRSVSSVIASASVALATGLSPGIWFQAVRAEVYALNTVLCLGMIQALLLWKKRPEATRYVALMALLGGLGLANHHLLTGLVGLVGLLFILASRPLRERLLSPLLGLLAGLVVAGLLVYAYLVVRAGAGWRMWGDPTTLSGFFSMVSASAFHISVTEMPRAPVPVALLMIFESWIDLLGWPLFFGGFLGLCVLLARRKAVGGLLLGLALAGALSKAIMYLDVENPDDHAYFLVGMEALALGTLGLLEIPGLLRRNGARWRRAFVALVAILAAASGALLVDAHRPWCNLAHFTGPDVLNRHFHERVPPGALFLPSYYATFFNHLYFREVENRRPDVTMVHQSLYSRFDGGAAYARDMVARHPEVEPLFEEFQRTGGFPLQALRKMAGQREVLLENDTLAITLPDVPHLARFSLGEGGLPIPADELAFAGPGVLDNVPRRIGWDEGRIQRTFWTRFYKDLEVNGAIHPELAKLLVWYHYRNALYFVNKRAARRALLEIKLARHLKPDFARLFEFDNALSNPQ